LDYAGQRRLACDILMRDRDGAFSKAFEQVFKDHGVQVKPVGPRAPNLNAFIERWIQSLKQEALDHFLVFGKTHFDYIVSEYVAYYHECRPHQGLDNKLPPSPRGQPDDDAQIEALPLDPSKIQCEHRLGGILKHYYRNVA
jgi:putative transposase